MSIRLPSFAHLDPSRELQLGGLCWLLAVVFFLGQAAAQTVFTPAYSLLDDRISDLGNTTCGQWLTYAYACSPLHGLMNSVFITTGLLFVLGAILTWRAWPRRRLTTAGLTSVVLAGLGFVLVGLNPENVNLGLHLAGATNLLTSNLALLLLGLATRQDGSWRPRLSLGLAGVGWLGLLCGPFLVLLTGHGGGLAERLALYPVVVWLVVLGGAFVRQPRALSHTPTTRHPANTLQPIGH
jgi:hypothetical membrane protein